MSGSVGYVNKELIQQHIPPASLADKVKVYVCGPPGQVAALAGKKDGMKQGPLAGTLKELGYTEEQVRFTFYTSNQSPLTGPSNLVGVQVLDARSHRLETKEGFEPEGHCR